MKLTEDDIDIVEGEVWLGDNNGVLITARWQDDIKKTEQLAESIKQQILKNQDNIEPDKAFEYVMENYYDEVKEAVFEQEADNRRE